MSAQASPQVLVIGGGPAGASAAGVLARAGVSVRIYERAHFPRHHVGESLQPATVTLLDRHLGLGPALAAQGFANKFGAVYVWGESRAPWRVLFDPRLERDLPGLDEEGLLRGGYEAAFQVERARFDQLILDAAAREGAEVCHGYSALGPLLEPETGRVLGLRLRGPDGEEFEQRADYVLDASGQSCVIGRALGLTEPIADLRATATYAYYEGAGGVPGPLGRHVQLVVTIPEGWVWFIPTSATVTSVGIVSRDRSRMSLERFEELLGQTEALPLAGARRLPGPSADQPLYFARDWSFTHARFAGPGFLLLGDAACFVDPVLSGGVDAAVRAGCDAALTLLRAFEDPAADPAPLLARYDQRTRRDFVAYLRLARYWYGNNRSVEGLFWAAHESVVADSLSTPMRAFVYLTTGHYAADQHLKVFQEWQEQTIFRSLGVDKAALRRARAAR